MGGSGQRFMNGSDCCAQLVPLIRQGGKRPYGRSFLQNLRRAAVVNEEVFFMCVCVAMPQDKSVSQTRIVCWQGREEKIAEPPDSTTMDERGRGGRHADLDF